MLSWQCAVKWCWCFLIKRCWCVKWSFCQDLLLSRNHVKISAFVSLLGTVARHCFSNTSCMAMSMGSIYGFPASQSWHHKYTESGMKRCIHITTNHTSTHLQRRYWVLKFWILVGPSIHFNCFIRFWERSVSRDVQAPWFTHTPPPNCQWRH